jgi:hypothetical protein
MAITEHTINDALAAVLRTTRRAWSETGVLNSENTGILKHAGKRPDILVTEPNVSPVVIETEVMPAATVEAEAASRLGDQIRATGRAILSSLAVRLPMRLRLRSGAALTNELMRADDLDVALFTGSSPTSYSRWPSSGWLRATVADLSILTQSATVPPEVIDEAANLLVNGVSDAAGLLHDMAASHPGAVHKISEELRQADGEQTRRMATTILANAFVFMESLTGGPGGFANVRSLEDLRSPSGGLAKGAILAEWVKILSINYWPIFDIARRILEHVPAQYSKPLIERLATTAERLLENSLMRSHDLTGAVFQRLIADRKFLSAYYTTPAAAALLAGLSIDPERAPSGGVWSDAASVTALRIADFACGTGTLLSTVYQRVGQLHELAGGDAEAVHPQMMAKGLIGCDVLPAAAHLTASMLAGAHPTTKYTQSTILTVVYGKQLDGRVALGSLDLLDPQGKFDIVAITAKAAGSLGEAERQTWTALPHSSFDLVIMNPPFVRDTGHEGKKIGVSNPMFAAFSISKGDQKEMAKVVKKLTVGTSAHGNAGEASIFLVLADRKLNAEGTLALVMPLSLLSGEAWEESRRLLAKNYRDLILMSIAGAADNELSFSADTDMAECLVIGRKAAGGSSRATFVVLGERPKFPMLGASIATQIRRLVAAKGLHRLEDGPVGATPIHFGDDRVGYAVDAPLTPAGGWSPVRVADVSLAQAAWQMIARGRCWLPSMNEADAPPILIKTIEAIGGEIGHYHADINGKTATGGIRGPFDIAAVKPGEAPTYPALWAHDTKEQRTISFAGDSQGMPRKGKTKAEQAVIDKKIASVWASASHIHFNRDFRFNSQASGMQFTPDKTMGGAAWISIKLGSIRQQKALALWANTSLGFLLHWHHANRQQSGRGRIGVLPLKTLPVIDVTALTAAQLDAAGKIFAAFANRDLLPVYRLDEDLVRQELDARFGTEVLDLHGSLFAAGGPVDLLRRKLAAEPSIRGNKSAERFVLPIPRPVMAKAGIQPKKRPAKAS